MFGSLTSVLTALLGGLGGIATLFKTLTFVPTGNLGLKFRFGELILGRDGEPRVVEPGLRWIIPFIETVKHFHVQRVVQTEPQSVMRPNLQTWDVIGAIEYNIGTPTGLKTAITTYEDIDERVRLLFSDLLGRCISNADPEASREVICETLRLQVRGPLAEYGFTATTVTKVSLPLFAPSQMTQAALLFPDRSVLSNSQAAPVIPLQNAAARPVSNGHFDHWPSTGHS